MKCMRCGWLNEADADYCMKCRAPLRAQGGNAIERKRRNQAVNKVLVGLIAVLSVALLVSLVVVIVSIPKPQKSDAAEDATATGQAVDVEGSAPVDPGGNTELPQDSDLPVEVPVQSQPVQHVYRHIESSGSIATNEPKEAEPEPEKPTQASEQEIYALLTEYYRMASDYDGRIAVCADEFNNHCFDTSASSRSSLARSATNLEDEIVRAWQDLANMRVPSSSVNYDAWYDMQELYECLWGRIDVICQAWDISLQYDNPADHNDEVLRPIEESRGPGGNNVYYTRYKELYPRISIVKP